MQLIINNNIDNQITTIYMVINTIGLVIIVNFYRFFFNIITIIHIIIQYNYILKYLYYHDFTYPTY